MINRRRIPLQCSQKQLILVITHPPSPLAPPWCDCCVYAQTLISSLHTKKQAWEHSKTEDFQCNGLSKKFIRTLWLQTSSTHPSDDVAFRKVSTMRAYFIPTPHNIQWRYCRGSTKNVLHPKYTPSTREIDMYHHNLYSEFMSAIQDEVFIISEF